MKRHHLIDHRYLFNVEDHLKVSCYLSKKFKCESLFVVFFYFIASRNINGKRKLTFCSILVYTVTLKTY